MYIFSGKFAKIAVCPHSVFGVHAYNKLQLYHVPKAVIYFLYLKKIGIIKILECIIMKMQLIQFHLIIPSWHVTT